MSTEDAFSLEDSQPFPFPKRTRIPRACSTCQKKKIKCDGRMPCASCRTSSMECHFKPVEKKPTQRKGTRYIQALEERLGRMESMLKRSNILTADGNANLDPLPQRPSQSQSQPEPELEQQISELPQYQLQPAPSKPHRGPQGQSPRHHNPLQLEPQYPAENSAQYEIQNQQQYGGKQSASPPEATISESSHATSNAHSSSRSPEEAGPGQQNLQQNEYEHRKILASDRKSSIRELSDIMCSLATSSVRQTPPSSVPSNGFSIFSPEGIKWINEKSGDSSFEDTIQSCFRDNSKLDYWSPDVFESIFSRPVLRKLPPKAEALTVLADFFRHFNSIFPLFHETTFMHLVERHYAGNPYSNIGWWASFNVVLAIAHRLRDRLHVQSHVAPEDDDNLKAWDYLRNAAGVITELTWRSKDILGVQALLGMALFMQGTPNPEPSAALLAAAIRLSHSIGLHDLKTTDDSTTMDPVEMEQRRRVFWIAYRLDKDICLRLGRPLAQEDDDMNVELPSEDPEDDNGNISLPGGGKVNLFRLTSEFAVIESRVYKKLYSRKAAKQSEHELLYTIGELDYLLEEWKESLPMEFQPENDIEVPDNGLILHILVLHFSYYNTLIAIHRTSVHHGYWTSRSSKNALQDLNERPLNPRVFSSASLCVTAARASIKLIKHIPLGEYGYIWVILYYPVSALVTLFANILQNPTEPRAKSDIRLMNTLIEFLSKLNQEGHSVVRRMLRVCTELERIARVVTESARTDPQRPSKRKAKGALEITKKHPTLPAQFGLAASQPTLRSSKGQPLQDSPESFDDSHDMFPTNFALALNAFAPPPNQFMPDYSAFDELLRTDMTDSSGIYDPNFMGEQDPSMSLTGFI